MNKAKTTIEIAKECGLISQDYSEGELSGWDIGIEAFRKPCIADYVSQCELVAWQDKFRNVIKDDARKNYIKMNCQIGHAGYDIPLFTLPNDGELV